MLITYEMIARSKPKATMKEIHQIAERLRFGIRHKFITKTKARKSILEEIKKQEAKEKK